MYIIDLDHEGQRQPSLRVPMPWISFISVAGGALLGLLSTALVSGLRHRHTVTLRLLDQYFEVRKAVTETTSDLAHLDTFIPRTEDEWTDHKRRVVKLFYQHYDLLPQPVLEALLLLHASLSDTSGGLYKVFDNTVLPMNKTEVHGFIDRCSFYKNAKYILLLALSSSDPAVRKNAAVTLHARHVLVTLNYYASLKQLLKMNSEFRKQTLLVPRAVLQGAEGNRQVVPTKDDVQSRALEDERTYMW